MDAGTQELLLKSVDIFVSFLSFVLFAYVIMSWIPQLRDTAAGRFVVALADPILTPIRGWLKKSPVGGPGMVIDLSVFIAYFLMTYAQTFIRNVFTVAFNG